MKRSVALKERSLAASPAKSAAHDLQRCLATEVRWSATKDALHPWRAKVDRSAWSLRVNDFPSQHLFTLLIGKLEVGAFNEWPEAWHRLELHEHSAKTDAPAPMV